MHRNMLAWLTAFVLFCVCAVFPAAGFTEEDEFFEFDDDYDFGDEEEFMDDVEDQSEDD